MHVLQPMTVTAAWRLQGLEGKELADKQTQGEKYQTISGRSGVDRTYKSVTRTFQRRSP